jgi:autophagy-related protein 9
MANLEAGVAQDEHDNSGGTDHASEASDEEVPHSFMVETSPAARRKALLPQARGQRRVATGSHGTRSDGQQKRASAGLSASGTGPLLPTTHPIPTRIPHPDDIEEEDENDFDQDYVPLLRASKTSNSASRRRKGKGRAKMTQDPADRRPDAMKTGLDEYQQALWRWVNVYNLDEYLQEVP